MLGHSYQVTVIVGINTDFPDEEMRAIVSKKVWESLNKDFPTQIVSVEKIVDL